MYTFIDQAQTILVADETLIASPNPVHDMTVPGEPERGHFIRAVGDSAFRDNMTLIHIRLPDTLSAIGPNAFNGCKSLKEIAIPPSVKKVDSCAFYGCETMKRVVFHSGVVFGNSAFSSCKALHFATVTLPGPEYASLLEHSRESADGRSVVMGLDRTPWLKSFCAAAGFNGPADETAVARIPALFQDTGNPLKFERRSLFGTALCMRFDRVSGAVSEDESVRGLIRSGNYRLSDPATEERNDFFLRAERPVLFQPLTLVLYRRDRVKRRGGAAEVTLEFLTGWWYWQSAQKVLWEDRVYYVYSRNYPTHDPALPYARLDMAVYDGDGLVTDRRLSRDIYAKYKLPALL